MANHSKEELAQLVAVILDGTGIDPKKEFIDMVIPDCILHNFDPFDILIVAYKNGFMIGECCSCRSRYKANGVWLEPELPLALELSRHRPLSHGLCDKCYDSYVSALNMQAMKKNSIE